MSSSKRTGFVGRLEKREKNKRSRTQ